MDGISWSKRKIAIVGMAPTSRDDAPWDDDSWSIWAMNNAHRHVKRANVWWEMHSNAILSADESRRHDSYQWHRSASIPIVVTQPRPDWPTAQLYPIDEVRQRFPHAMWTSTVAYQMAFAILLIENGHMEPTIGLWGVEMSAGSEYAGQRASLAYFAGVCETRGIELVLPPGCELLHSPFLYGYEAENSIKARAHLIRRGDALDRVLADLTQADAELQRRILLAKGAREEISHQLLNWTVDHGDGPRGSGAETLRTSLPEIRGA